MNFRGTWYQNPRLEQNFPDTQLLLKPKYSF